MAMSDCGRCWETPCACGHEYEAWSVERLDTHIKILEVVKQRKLGNSPIPQLDELGTPPSEERFSSVWDALEDNPEKAAVLARKSRLMMNIHAVIQHYGKEELCRRFSVLPDVVENVWYSRFNVVTLDELITLSRQLNLNPN